MKAKLEQLLEDHGCKCDRNEFCDALQELRAVMFPSWTDEEMLVHPEDSMLFCRVVRARFGASSLPDDFILRTLINDRKQGRPRD